jgi:hypothetical protein
MFAFLNVENKLTLICFMLGNESLFQCFNLIILKTTIWKFRLLLGKWGVKMEKMRMLLASTVKVSQKAFLTKEFDWNWSCNKNGIKDYTVNTRQGNIKKTLIEN